MTRLTRIAWSTTMFTLAGCGAAPGEDPAAAEESSAEETLSATVVSLDATGKPSTFTQSFTRRQFDAMIARRMQRTPSSHTAEPLAGEIGSSQSALIVRGDCNDDNTLWIQTGVNNTGSLLCLIGPMDPSIYFDLATVPGFRDNVRSIWPGLSQGGGIWRGGRPGICGGDCVIFPGDFTPRNTPACAGVGNSRYVALRSTTDPAGCFVP